MCWEVIHPTVEGTLFAFSCRTWYVFMRIKLLIPVASQCQMSICVHILKIPSFSYRTCVRFRIPGVQHNANPSVYNCRGMLACTSDILVPIVPPRSETHGNPNPSAYNCRGMLACISDLLVPIVPPRTGTHGNSRRFKTAVRNPRKSENVLKSCSDMEYLHIVEK